MGVIKLPHCVVKLLCGALGAFILARLESVSVVLSFVGNGGSVCVLGLGRFDGHFCFSLSLGWFVVSSLSGC